jgi:DNA-directed RNA polymerase specialized sigma24 family protein
MTAREYLERARTLDGEIEAKREHLARLRSQLTGRAQVITGMPGGGRADWTDTVARAVELERELIASIDGMLALRREISQMIARVPDGRHRQLLELRYLCGKKWEEVAEAMSYDVRWIYQLHEDALAEVEKLMEVHP